MPKGSRHVPFGCRIAARKSSAVSSSHFVESFDGGRNHSKQKEESQRHNSLHKRTTSRAMLLPTSPVVPLKSIQGGDLEGSSASGDASSISSRRRFLGSTPKIGRASCRERV